MPDYSPNVPNGQSGGGGGSDVDVGALIGSIIEGFGPIVAAVINAAGQAEVTTESGNQFIVVDGQAYPLGYSGPSRLPATNGNGNGNGMFGDMNPMYLGIGVLVLFALMMRR